MKHAPFAVVTSILIGLLAGCGSNKRSAPDVLKPPTESGAVSADLSGLWRITQVDPKLWITVGGQTDADAPVPASGLMPPVVGAVITIAGPEFVDGNGMPLRKEAVGDAQIVTSYLNQVDDRFGIYTMRRHVDPMLAIADGGGLTLQMAMGTIDRDHLLGVVYHKVGIAFPAPGAPKEVMAVLHLERVR